MGYRMFTLLTIQPILILQEYESQIGSYLGYFKADREIQPPLSTKHSMTCSGYNLSGTDLLIPAFHPRDKFINLTRKPSKRHSLRQLPG